MRIDLEKFVQQSLWPLRRRPRAVALLRTILFPIWQLTQQLEQYKKRSRRQATATAQHLSVVYNISVIAEKPINSIQIWGRGNNSYTVNIPAPVTASQQLLIEDHLRKVKLAATNFTVNIYNQA